jgi:hypothetical protein
LELVISVASGSKISQWQLTDSLLFMAVLLAS